MATHTYNPSTARKARGRESGLHDSLHHIEIHPAQGGLIVDHHHLMKHEEAGIGGKKYEQPTDGAPKRPSVESGLHAGGEFGTEAKTGIGGRYVFGKTEDALDHLEHHLGQMLEEHSEQRGATQNNEPGEDD